MNELLKALLGYFMPRFYPAATTSADTECTVVKLAKHEWRSIPNPAGMLLECLEGDVTITQEGDPRDQLLVVGETYRVVRRAHLYVQAQRSAELRIARAAAVAKRHDDSHDRRGAHQPSFARGPHGQGPWGVS